MDAHGCLPREVALPAPDRGKHLLLVAVLALGLLTNFVIARWGNVGFFILPYFDVRSDFTSGTSTTCRRRHHVTMRYATWEVEGGSAALGSFRHPGVGANGKKYPLARGVG